MTRRDDTVMDTSLNALKKHVFFEFMSLAGRVFVLVRYSENVVLGNRMFTAEEKENGIVLVFNLKMNFMWDEYGITATLVFGTSPQKCFIPANDIEVIYSPDLKAQFMASHQQPPDINHKDIGCPGTKIEQNDSKGKKQKGHVIEVDFTRKRKYD